MKYSWLSRINKDWIALYSKSGDTVLVSKELAKLTVSEGELQKAVLAYEKQHNIDGLYNFSLRNELKCPNCSYPLTTRSNESFEDLIEGSIVFLESMTFINDDKKYKVEIDAN
jgi:hypothetical protein